jgi:amino acid transporter
MSAIVGEAGVGHAFLILFSCTSTTFLTVLSMSAIVTNGKIRTGGVYYMVSRSLGPASGGAIGILYYLATTFSASMSILGAVEAFMITSNVHLGPDAFSMRFFALILLGILISINLFGMRFVSKTGLMIISFVFISILSMLLGLLTSKARNATI